MNTWIKIEKYKRKQTWQRLVPEPDSHLPGWWPHVLMLWVLDANSSPLPPFLESNLLQIRRHHWEVTQHQPHHNVGNTQPITDRWIAKGGTKSVLQLILQSSLWGHIVASLQLRPHSCLAPSPALSCFPLSLSLEGTLLNSTCCLNLCLRLCFHDNYRSDLLA